MAKKRTKKQKAAIKQKRKQLIEINQVAEVKKDLNKKENIILKQAYDLDEIAIKSKQLLVTPIKFIRQDLLKTALVTAIIIVILIVLAIYY